MAMTGMGRPVVSIPVIAHRLPTMYPNLEITMGNNKYDSRFTQIEVENVGMGTTIVSVSVMVHTLPTGYPRLETSTDFY